IRDLGDIVISRPDREHKQPNSKLRNLRQVAAANEQLGEMVDEEMKKNRFPLILGGEHSIAIGRLAGISKHYNNLGLIWYDANGDLNSEEASPSANIQGLPLDANLGMGHSSFAHILGYTPEIKPAKIV